MQNSRLVRPAAKRSAFLCFFQGNAGVGDGEGWESPVFSEVSGRTGARADVLCRVGRSEG